MKTILRSPIFILICLLILAPLGAGAATTLLTGDKISIEADESVAGDYYVSVGPLGTTVMSGTVEEDMYALAGSLTINGTIGKDLGAVAGVAHINAPVSDDVRIIAAEAVISGPVEGDVFVIGGALKILSTADIKGDVIFFGGDAEIAGTVGGSIYGTANSMRVDATVAQNVNVKTARELTLGAKANIAGNVQYTSVSDLVRAQEANVAGEIQKQSVTEEPANAGVRDFLLQIGRAHV